MFSKIPTDTSVIRTEVPPYEINGNGIPFAGTIEITTLILNNAWTMMPVINPIPRSVPNLSGAVRAARLPRHSSKPNAVTTARVPIRPNSSPTTEKIKS